ncbi:hypothetical protein Q9251_18410 [Alkalihalobacillus macyae]|uniref:hypothetical protein n=1 Tax=Guptibacillus hwajinpoensis TaxID=208199 RepID=UPI00273C21FA|nr:hypothetical protein [Alkalihalobacillus macyae]MDP4552856.1 hypothetical protein [Alkalihalobacillus macyae]
MANEFALLTISPLYILMVVLSIIYLIVLREDKGCIVTFGRIGSVAYILMYIIALILFIF